MSRFKQIGLFLGSIAALMSLMWVYKVLGVGGDFLGCFLAAVTLLIFILLLVPIYFAISKSADLAEFKRLKTWKTVQPPRAELQMAPAKTIAEVAGTIRQNATPIQWDNLLPAIDALCDLYLNGTEDTRETIRQSFPDASDLLLGYARLSAFKLGQPLEKPDLDLVLRRGIAAVIIENLRKEWRDSSVALGNLYQAAQKADLGPGKIVEAMAEIASSSSPHPEIADHPSMRVFLTDLAKNRRQAGP